MSYPIPDGSIVESTVRYELAGQTCLNIVHYRWTSTSTLADGPTVINAFADEWDNLVNGATKLLADATTTEVSIIETVHQMIYPTRWARRVYPARTVVGTLTPPTCAANYVATAIKRSQASGRHAQGRLTISGIPTTALADNRWSSAQVDLMQAYSDYMVGTYVIDIPPGQFEPRIYNRLNPVNSQAVESITVVPEPRALRRRQLRIGI